MVLPLENHSTDRYSPNTGSFASILIPIGYDVGQPRAVIRAPAQMLQAVVFMSRLRWKLPEPIRSEVTFRESQAQPSEGYRSPGRAVSLPALTWPSRNSQQRVPTRRSCSTMLRYRARAEARADAALIKGLMRRTAEDVITIGQAEGGLAGGLPV